MDEELIDQIADILASEWEVAKHYENGFAAINNLTIAFGVMINNQEPTYDMRYFYNRAGMDEPYPNHPIRR